MFSTRAVELILLLLLFACCIYLPNVIIDAIIDCVLAVSACFLIGHQFGLCANFDDDDVFLMHILADNILL